MIKLLRLVRGYVDFKVSGGFPERFLNLCKLRGVNLYSTEISGDVISASTDIDGFSHIHEISERSGMSVKVIAERGLPFFIRRHKYRCGFLIGIGLMIIFIFIMSSFIWQVEVVGEDSNRNALIERDLRELGVYSGVRKSSIDILAVQEEMLLRRSDITWISINIFGTKARVEYTPAKEKIPIVDTTSPVNIVAQKRGRITLVECYSGDKMVKEGDYVAEGDLLISGVMSNADGSEDIIHAAGRVMAQTESLHEYSVCLQSDGYLIGAEASSYSINIFGLRIPLGKGVRGDFSSLIYMNLRANDSELPVGIVRCDSLMLCEQKITLTEHQATLMCVCDATLAQRSEYGDCTVESIEYTCGIKHGVFLMNQTVICVENIAREEIFYVEEN